MSGKTARMKRQNAVRGTTTTRKAPHSEITHVIGTISPWNRERSRDHLHGTCGLSSTTAKDVATLLATAAAESRLLSDYYELMAVIIDSGDKMSHLFLGYMRITKDDGMAHIGVIPFMKTGPICEDEKLNAVLKAINGGITFVSTETTSKWAIAAVSDFIDENRGTIFASAAKHEQSPELLAKRTPDGYPMFATAA